MLGQTGRREQLPCRHAPCARPLLDGLALHLGDLRKHSYNELANPRRDDAQPKHMETHALLQQNAYGVLDIDGVASKAVDREDVQRIAFAHILHHGLEPGPARGGRASADTLVAELSVERAIQRGALGFDRLRACRDAIICNSCHFFLRGQILPRSFQT